MDGRGIARVAFGLLLATSAAAFAVRLWFVLSSGPFAATTGFEEFCHYNIWKTAHGLPLYESPLKVPYLLTSYNVGFYEAYAAWIRIWGTLDGRLVACTRMLTLLFTAAACGLQVRLVRSLVDPARWSAVWGWGLSFLFWFGSTFSPWTPVTTRPDAAAVAFALAGLLAALRGDERGGTRDCLVASGCFFLAWSLKQSVVWIYAGVLLHLLVSRKGWKPLLLVLAPFATLSAVVIGAGGEAYRYNVFVVPGIYYWFPRQSGLLVARLVGLNLFFWVFGAAAIRAAFEPSVAETREELERRQIDRRRAVVVIAIPPVVFGVAQLALHGSNVNNMIEAAALIAALATAWWIKQWAGDCAGLRAAIGTVLLFTMLPLPCVHLMQAARGVPETEIHGVSIGNAIKLNRAQLAQRRAFAAWMATLPKPVWIHDAMLELPWFANENQYPSFPFDHEFQADAAARHLLKDGGLFSLVRSRHFAALILRPGFDARWIRTAEQAGYIEAQVPAGFEPLATEYGLNRPAPRLFVRP